MTEDLIIKIRQDIDNTGLKGLSENLKLVRAEMDKMVESGKRNTQEYKNLSSVTGELVSKQKQLRNEQKGLDANFKSAGTWGAKITQSASSIMSNYTVIAAGVGMAFGKAKEYIGDALQKSIEFERALTTLRFATDNLTFENLKEFNKGFKTTSIFSTKDIVIAETFLSAQGRTEEQIKKVIKAAMDLSVVTGDDLDTSVKKLDMTYEGSIGRMGKLEGSLKNLTKDELENGAAIEILGDKYKGFSEKQAETLAGKLLIIEKNLKGLEKTFGDSLIRELGNTFDATNKSASDLNKTFETANNVISKVVGVGATLVRTLNPLVIITKAVNGAFSILSNTWKVITDDGYKFKTFLSDLVNDISDAVPIIAGVKSLFNLFSSSDSGDTQTPFSHILNFTKKISKEGEVIRDKQMHDYEFTVEKPPEKKGGHGSIGSSKTEQIKSEEEIMTEQITELIQGQDTLLRNLELKGEMLFKFIENAKKELDVYNLQTLSLENQNKILEQQKKLKETNPFGTHWAGLDVNQMGVIKEDVAGRDMKEFEKPEKEKDYTLQEVFQGALESSNRIKDIFSNMANTLGLSADSFVGKMISGFDTVSGIIQTIMATMQAYDNAKGFIGIVTKFFGFAEGGLFRGYGSTTSDSNLIRVSDGEYIVNASATARYLPLLQAINGNNSSLSNLINSYANGGMVNGGGAVNVFLTGTMDGQKFFRVNEKQYRQFQNATLMK